jgi:predicted transcriptional regulator
MKRLLREQARDLRRQGMSVRDIAATLGVSKASASMWVRDIELTAEQIELLKINQRQYGARNAGSRTNRKKHLDLREQYQQAGRMRAREMRPLHMAGCMLYWAEGAKRRNIYFANSDPNMILFFMRFLREEMNVADSKIVIYIHCHTSDPAEMQELENYWVNLLELTRSNLRKTYTKKGSDIQHSILKYGVCGIGVYSVELVEHIFGAIQEYGGFDNPDWLF